MTEYTEEQVKELIENAKRLEQWTIAEDTIRRQLFKVADDLIAQGIWHPFLKDVAKSMYSVAITGRNFTQTQQESKDEVQKSD